jgi:putative oxidoreductase
MKVTFQDWIALLGRVLMSVIFIYGGVMKARTPAATMAYFGKLGLPMPGAGYALTLAVEIGIGVLFLIGFRARWAALVLAVWCVATALVTHYHPEDRGQMIHFMKNICMAGGFLQIAARGAGRLSFDRR